MANFKTVTAANFGSELVRILEAKEQQVKHARQRDVRAAGMVAWDAAEEMSPRDTRVYAFGWKLDIEETGHGTAAHIHQIDKPSLTHLLEKTHGMLVGRPNRYGMKKYIGTSTPEPHIEPAADLGAADLARRVGL